MIKVKIIKSFYILIAFIGLITCYSESALASEIETYQAPQDLKPAPDYKIKANDSSIFVYNSPYNPYAIFNFKGSINIEIDTENDLKWVDIRPLSDSIQWKIKGSSLFFTLTHPCNLSIELNKEKTRALFLFTGPINSPDTTHGKLIRYAGGKIYNAGTIELNSNDILYIEGGAIVRGNVHSSNSDNIKIIGNGVLDGTLAKPPSLNRMIDLEDCHHILIRDITIHDSPTWTIVTKNCSDLDINNVKEINWKFGSDGIDLVSTSHVNINNCFLKDNDDCIVIKSFDPDNKIPDSAHRRNPNVSDITIDHCTLWNMQWGNALEIGFELQCDSIQHVTFKNINIIHVERGAALSIHNGDYARVSDITYENINVEDAGYKLIDLAIFLSQYSLDRPSSGAERNSRYLNGAWDGVLKVNEGEEVKYEKDRGYINNIHFKNIDVVEGTFPFSIISGYNSTHTVKNISFDNLKILNQKITSAGQGHFFINNAGNVNFK